MNITIEGALRIFSKRVEEGQRDLEKKGQVFAALAMASMSLAVALTIKDIVDVQATLPEPPAPPPKRIISEDVKLF